MQTDDQYQHVAVPDHQAPREASAHGGHGDHSEARVTTAFSPRTGRRLKISAAAGAIVLIASFLTVYLLKASGESKLQATSKAESSVKQLVNVITVQSPGTTRPLTLPGETAAWNESTLYAR